jgi:hypothetical protein
MEPYPTYVLKHYCEALQNMLYPLRMGVPLNYYFLSLHFLPRFFQWYRSIGIMGIFFNKKKKSARVFTHFKT